MPLGQGLQSDEQFTATFHFREMNHFIPYRFVSTSILRNNEYINKSKLLQSYIFLKPIHNSTQLFVHILQASIQLKTLSQSTLYTLSLNCINIFWFYLCSKTHEFQNNLYSQNRRNISRDLSTELWSFHELQWDRLSIRHRIWTTSRIQTVTRNIFALSSDADLEPRPDFSSENAVRYYSA